MLILDEPTNHLDLESREALEAALNEFPGSLLLVSHDRALLDAVGTRTVALEDRTLHSYVGGWPEYVRVREERAKAPTGRPPAAQGAGGQGPGARLQRRPTGRLSPGGARANGKRNPPARKAASRGDQRSLEREIEAAEAALRRSRTSWRTRRRGRRPTASARSTSRHEEAQRAVAELYERWEAVAAARVVA